MRSNIETVKRLIGFASSRATTLLQAGSPDLCVLPVSACAANSVFQVLLKSKLTDCMKSWHRKFTAEILQTVRFFHQTTTLSPKISCPRAVYRFIFPTTAIFVLRWASIRQWQRQPYSRSVSLYPAMFELCRLLALIFSAIINGEFFSANVLILRTRQFRFHASSRSMLSEGR